MSAERDANIDVVTDSNGLIALRDMTDGDVIRQNNGQLQIDFTAGERAGGVNVDSQYLVGAMKQNHVKIHHDALGEYLDPERDHLPGARSGEESEAFAIVNQDTETHTVSVNFDATGTVGGSILYFQGAVIESDGSFTNPPDYKEIVIKDGQTQDSVAVDLRPGAKLAFSLVVNTRNGSTSDDLSGTMTVSATASSSQ